MNPEEIIDVIIASKKYTNLSSDKTSNVVNNRNSIIYNIGDKSYLIHIYDHVFQYDHYSDDIKPIKIKLIKSYNIIPSTTTILVKFGEMIKYIKKLHFFIINKDEQLLKFGPVMSKYIKNKYNYDFDQDNTLYAEKFLDTHPQFYFRITFPKTKFYVRRRLKMSSFNVTKERKRLIDYDCFIRIKDGNYNLSLHANYCSSKSQIVINQIDEYYKSLSKDVTKIIRCEKLKNLMLINND